jgi:hypothetical protein
MRNCLKKGRIHGSVPIVGAKKELGFLAWNQCPMYVMRVMRMYKEVLNIK